jgi:hypothetical protein
VFTNIHSITIPVLILFLVCSAQSMKKESKQHIYYEDYYLSGYEKDDDRKNIQNVEREKPKLFNESDIYFSMSDSGCLDVIEKKPDEACLRCSLYESVFLDEELMGMIGEIEVAEEKKAEAKRFNEYIEDNFFVIPEPLRKITEIECSEPDKNFVKEVKVVQSLNIVEDYENPSPNASPINLDSKEVITEPVSSNWFARANDMVSWASDKILPVGDYLHELNKDIAKI